MTANVSAVQLLIADHNRVKDLFQRFHSTTDPDQHQQIAQEVMLELDIHAVVEEEIFYPAMRERGDAQDKALVADSYEDHAEVKELIANLRTMPPDDPQFQEVLGQLQNAVELHVQEEEAELLPKAQEELLDRLDALGEEMLARKQQLLSTMQQTG